MAGPAVHPDLADNGEDDVLGRHAGRQSAPQVHGKCPGLALQQALGCEDVGDLGGSDAECQRAERPVRAGVGVPADNGLAGLGGAEFRADDVDDAALVAVHAAQLEAEFLAVAFHLQDLLVRGRLADHLEFLQ